MFCIRPTTAAAPILLRAGRATKMAVFWSYFRDFVGAQKIEDFSESKFFFAEVFQIKSSFVLGEKIYGVRCTLRDKNEKTSPQLFLWTQPTHLSIMTVSSGFIMSILPSF